jgi:hypothetical protein
MTLAGPPKRRAEPRNRWIKTMADIAQQPSLNWVSEDFGWGKCHKLRPLLPRPPPFPRVIWKVIGCSGPRDTLQSSTRNVFRAARRQQQMEARTKTRSSESPQQFWSEGEYFHTKHGCDSSKHIAALIAQDGPWHVHQAKWSSEQGSPVHYVVCECAVLQKSSNVRK